MKTKELSECVHVCQSIQLTAMDIVGELTSNPDLLNVPAYKELVERVYMAASQAVTVSRMIGDERTATFTTSVCNKLVQLANL